VDRVGRPHRNLTAYDAADVELAETLDVELLTTDVRLAMRSGAFPSAPGLLRVDDVKSRLLDKGDQWECAGTPRRGSGYSASARRDWIRPTPSTKSSSDSA